jgi:hypothetical protein
MKTSNRLVLLIVLTFFGAIFGSAIILKQEFEKIDFDDPFYGLSRNEIAAFKAVKLQGNYHGLVEIRPGEKYEILHPTSMDIFEWEVRQDTLYLSYTGEAQRNLYFSEQTFNKSSAAAYVLAPSISSVASENMSCRIYGWKTDQFQASFSGPNGGMSFKENTFKKLSATSTNQGLLQLEDDNVIGNADIIAEDKSEIRIVSQQIDSLQLQAEPEAKIQLPGALLEKIKQ